MSAKSVIELWMWGGPSSLETFDPKPDAPVEYNNGLKAIDTNVPGIRLHEWWPELARCAELYSLVRTMTHPHFGHETATYLMQTGRDPGGGEVYPAIGAVIAMMKEKDYHGDLPPFVILTKAKGRFSEIGFLGERYAPLVTGGSPNAKRFVVDGIVPPGDADPEAVRRRFDLLSAVDVFGEGVDFSAFEAAGAAARKVIEGDAAQTFDLDREPAEVRDRYGRTEIGQSLLAARRLVEYGVPYVTVNMNGWDSHKRHFETMKQRTADTDRALAALLRDLADRGLLDSTLVWASGEFGRTTKIDREAPWNGGRNHYPKCFSALVAGGGFKGGCVVGESDETATNVVKRPVTPVDFLGSIYELCGIDPDGPMPNPLGKKLPVLPPPSKEGRLREIYKTVALAVCGAALAFGASAAEPYVGYVYPAGVQAGTTNRLLVGGQNFGGVRRGLVSGEGVTILSVEPVPSFPPPTQDQRRHLTRWLEGIAKGDLAEPAVPPEAKTDEWRSNRWWSVLGELDPFRLSLVERDLSTRRNPLQASPSLRSQLIVTVAAAPDAPEGVREFRLGGGTGISPPRPFLVTAAPRTPEPRFAAAFRPRPERPLVATFPAVLDGQVFPGETDRWTLRLAKGRTVTLRTVARELQPYVGDAVPGFFNAALRLVDAKGREVAFADDFFFHPDPVLVFTPPADGDYTLEVRDLLFRGREDFVYSVAVTEGDATPSPREVPLWPKVDASVPEAAVVATFAGAVSAPGVTGVHELAVAAPGEYVFDLLGRRDGSPLDARVTVKDAGGRVLASVTDVTDAVHRGSIAQAEADPVFTVGLPQAGRYRVEVADEAGKGGAAWTYVLRVHRPAPRFAVWLARSSVALRPGQSAKAKVHVVRADGFAGPVRLEGGDRLGFDPDTVPAGTDVLEVALVSRARRAVPPGPVALTASAEVGGVVRSVPIVPSDEYNQAFAWNHLLGAREFLFWGLPPKAASKGRTPGR